MALNRAVPVNAVEEGVEEGVEKGSWTAIIPIRSFSQGKTRLHAPGIPSGELIKAFASDVVDACAACPGIGAVIVVSPDPEVLDFATCRGARALREIRGNGINEAIDYARAAVPGPIVAILGDTPCLDAAVLTSVLDQAAQFPISFVPDASGVGTTMWCAQPASQGHSHFGHHSRAEHRATGAVELRANDASPTWARARRDVDTDVDLWDARRLGVGPATSALLDQTL